MYIYGKESAVVLGTNKELFEMWKNANKKQGIIILRYIKIHENTYR